MDLQLRRVVFSGQQNAQVETTRIKETPDEEAVLVRNHWTLISPGTEQALYTNQHDINGRKDHPYPIYPGYAAAGVIEKVGGAVSTYQPGDRVLTFGNHASYVSIVPAATLCVKIPDELSLEFAPFARMALICLATLMTTPYLAGEWLGVVGLGLVGNLGAQFARLAGCKVVGFGRSTVRSQIAKKCGIPVLNAQMPAEAGEAIRQLTGGEGCRLVLETTGTAAGMLKAVEVAENGGTISLVGVPWLTEVNSTITQLMQPIFSRYLKIQGGWEWGLPMREFEPKSTYLLPYRDSIERNARYALDEICSGRVQVEPLITHKIKPDEIQKVYQALMSADRAASGVLIDWRDE